MTQNHEPARESVPRGVLYVVAMPIGNPADLAPRAVRILSESDLIACEDTRRIGRTLAEHAIRTPTISYFEHNEERRIPALIERLRAGQTIALVTDAGTPAVSDPGYRLVRAALDAAIRVSTAPGPSAVIAALSIAGLPTDRFTFEGFLPVKAGDRRKALEALRREHRTMVFYEAARRLVETLEVMAAIFGDERDAVVTRELTKTYEETVRGRLSEIAGRFQEHPPLGEVTIVVAGAAAIEASGSEAMVIDEAVAIKVLREAGLSLKDATEILAKLTGTRRRELYQRALHGKQ